MHLSARVFSAAVLSENLPVSGNVFSFRSDFPVMLPALLPYFTTVFSCISSYCVSWHLTHSLVITAIQRRARGGMPCCFPAVRFGLAGSASPIPFRRKDLPTWFHLLLLWKAGSVWQASRQDNAEPSQICTSCPCVISRRDLRKSRAPNHSVGLPNCSPMRHFSLNRITPADP